MNEQRISVFGLGKLGCTMLACFAHKGWKVIGVDTNQDVIDKVNNGESPIYEPGVDELIRKHRNNIRATLNAQEAVLNSDISFVIVPTPSLNDGSFTTRYVDVAAAGIGSNLGLKKAYHVVVITSTVLPGDMEMIRSFLERTSGKTCGTDFGLCYNPDFIALGSVVKNFLSPDMILIGESDPKAGSMLHDIHEHLVDNHPRIHRMNFYNAELTKIALNSYCTLKITFANTLAEICEKMPGGDAEVVTTALGDDTRIGPKYIKGGLSYGGPCFPRDNRAFSLAASRFQCTAPLAKITDDLNNYHRKKRIPNYIKKLLKERDTDTIAILGLTYKSDTTLVEESAAIYIARALSENGITVRLYDPSGTKEAQHELDQLPNIQFAASARECLQGVRAVLIASPWPEFKKLTLQDFQSTMGHDPLILDAWSMLSLDRKDIDYRIIGKNYPPYSKEKKGST